MPQPKTPSAHEVVASQQAVPARELIRQARLRRGWTQQQLADAIEVSRSHMNRLEMGSVDMPRHLVERLSSALDLPELLERHVERELTDPNRETLRDSVVDRLVRISGLEVLTVVVADDLDVYTRIYDWQDGRQLGRARVINVVFPTVHREKELFHGEPIRRHVEYQIKRLTALQHGGLEGSDLRLHESDTVIASAVIARSSTGTECAYWAPLSALARTDGRLLPVTLRTDPTTINQLDGYAEEMTAESGRIRNNRAMCKVEPSTGVRFTRYIETDEDDVGEHEGVAVALVLVIGLCPRGEFGVGRRIIAYKRERARTDRERLSVFSSYVTDADVRHARALSEGSEPDLLRSRRGALAAALDTNAFIEANGGAIPDAAYQAAAKREMHMFGLDLPPERLRPIKLPPSLQLIGKETGESDGDDRRPPVAPALFVLELDATGDEPELDRLSAIAVVEEIGTADLDERADEFNDFLRRAREVEFLLPLLLDLGVVAR